MEEVKVITVGGFAFENPSVGEEALKEQEAIEYVNKQLNFNDTKSLLTLYNQMVTRRMFHTEVGYVYLKSIQEHLMKADVDPALIESIPVYIDIDETTQDDVKKSDNAVKKKPDTNGEVSNNIQFKNKERKLKQKIKKYQKLTVAFLAIAIVLVVTVVAMFVIAGTSDNPTILNYEEVLLNKYSSWEQDLQHREDELRKQQKLVNK